MKLIKSELVHLYFTPKDAGVYPRLTYTIKLFAENKHKDKYEDTFDLENSVTYPNPIVYLRSFMAVHELEMWLPMIKLVQKRIAADSANTYVRKLQHVCPILPGKTSEGRKEIIEHISLTEKAELLYQAERSAEYLGMKLVSAEA